MSSMVFLYTFSYFFTWVIFVLLTFCLYIMASDFVLLWILDMCIWFLCLFFFADLLFCLLFVCFCFLKTERKKGHGVKWVERISEEYRKGKTKPEYFMWKKNSINNYNQFGLICIFLYKGSYGIWNFESIFFFEIFWDYNLIKIFLPTLPPLKPFHISILHSSPNSWPIFIY